MKRYIHLYFSYVKRSIIARLSYKKDSFIMIFSFFIRNIASILSIYFIVNSIPSLEGWTMMELGFLYGFSMIPIALDHLFTDYLWSVSYFEVRTGRMDQFFLCPIPVLFQVISETFQVDGLGELVVGILMMSLCGSRLNVSWTFGAVLLLGVAAVFGAVIVTSIKIVFASLAFIFKTSGVLLQIAYNFSTYSRYPLKIFPKAIQWILTFLFPFALIVSIPVEIAIFRSASPYVLSLIIIGVAAVFLGIAIGVWNFCAKRYESSGS